MNAPKAIYLLRWTAIVLPLLGLLNIAPAAADEVAAPDAAKPEKKPKYYFKDIEATGLTGAENEAMARELVAAELSRKPVLKLAMPSTSRPIPATKGRHKRAS